jgi:prolyl-tRNA synthetase
MNGIPLRLEAGPRDIENHQVVIARRDTGEKVTVSLDELESKIAQLLDDVQNNLFEKALNHREEKTSIALNFEEFAEKLDSNKGFIKAMWCGDQACEDKIKEETGATSRCIPFEEEKVSDECVCCGKEAKQLVYWARAY